MTVDAAGCIEGNVTLLAGGSVTSPNAQFGGIGTVVLQSGTFQFTSVGYKTVRDPTNGTDVLSGSVTLSQRNPLTQTPGYDASGSVGVVRNGKTDAYSNIAVVTTAGDINNAISLVSGAYDLTTPRFGAKLSMTGNIATSSLTATSADGSNVQGVEATPSTSPPTRSYTVRATAGGAAVLTQTLADNDTAVQAALLNALN